MNLKRSSVLIIDLLSFNQFESLQGIIIQPGSLQMAGRNLMIFIGGIIIDALVRIAAGGIDGFLILPFPQMTTALGLIHGI